MSVQTAPAASTRRRPLSPWVIPAVVAAAGLGAVVLLRPDFSLIGEVSLAIRIHLFAAIAAFFLGVAMITSKKGRKFHKIAGWTWASIMMVVAGSSLFITQIFETHWSYIHVLSGLTLIGVPLGLAAARRHNVKLHRRQMLGVFWGGMVIAGGFTFLPGRFMWQMFFG